MVKNKARSSPYGYAVYNFSFSVGVVFFLLTALYTPATSFAEECVIDENAERSVLEQALAACQLQITENEKKLQQQTKERTNTEYDILLINQEINKANLRIRSSDLMIKNLGGEIVKKETTLDDLNSDLGEHKKFFKKIAAKNKQVRATGVCKHTLF